jgi:LuxR family maltose regulon positive regulatory protein
VSSARLPSIPAPDALALLRRGLEESHRGKFHALQTLAAAQDSFRASGNANGIGLCAAALMMTGQAMSSYRRFAEHIQSLAGLRDGSLEYQDHSEDLLAHAGLLAGLLMFAPADPFCDRCVARIIDLLEVELDVNLRFAAGRVALFYTEPREQREVGNRVNALIEPLMDRPELTPHRLGRWLTFRLRVAAAAKDRLQLERVKKRALELVRLHAEPDVTAWLAISDFDAALPRRDFERAQGALATIEAITDPTNLMDLRRFEWLQGRLALAKGDGDAALLHATHARKYSEDLEVPPPILGVTVALEAQARVLTGDLAEARAGFGEAAQMVAVLHAEEMRDMIRMVDAYEAGGAGRSDARRLLEAAFAAPRMRQFYDSFDTNPRFGATMCALALAQDVEPEFVRRIIEMNGYAPPPEAGASWPWPVKITTLGRFDVSSNGRPMAVPRKSPRKPLELLKALIAAGGRGIDKQRLADFLWDNATAEAASAAFDMAVMRLRKLLAVPEAIVVEDGKIGLDPARVWLDLWAFDCDVDALQPLLRRADNDATVATIGERMLALYRGPFLDNEEPQRWLLAARERTRQRFLRSLFDAGRYWEQRERWPEAAALYERGLDIDPIAEDLYRRLMRCHLAQRRPAEAARTFQRCREMLLAQLGVPPSAETEALYRSTIGS